MSVDTFYYCSKVDLVRSWWEGAFEETIASLSKLMADGKEQHPFLLSNEHISKVFIPGLIAIKNEQPDCSSLAEYCRAAVDQYLAAHDPANKKKSILKRLLSSTASEKEFEQLTIIVDHHKSLYQIAWTGPVQKSIYDTRFVDDYFSEFLCRYLPQEEANQYNGADTHNVGPPCLPEECNRLEKEVYEKLQLYTQTGYFIDSSRWLSRWERLDLISNLWSDLEAELGDRAAVEFLQQIKEIAAYANQHQVKMLKVFW